MGIASCCLVSCLAAFSLVKSRRIPNLWYCVFYSTGIGSSYIIWYTMAMRVTWCWEIVWFSTPSFSIDLVTGHGIKIHPKHFRWISGESWLGVHSFKHVHSYGIVWYMYLKTTPKVPNYSLATLFNATSLTTGCCWDTTTIIHKYSGRKKPHGSEGLAVY